MPRDSNGNYTLPAGNPVVANTVIEDTWANPTMEDLAGAMTDSLSRSGQGGMLAPFLNQDGTVGAPGISWGNEPTSGWYRKADGEFWYSVFGQDIFGISTLGIALAPGLSAEGIAAFINVQDSMPTGMIQGESWWESDTGAYLMNYVNPDDSETLVSLASAGGDFIPYQEKAAANGVATLDANGNLVQTSNLFPIGAIYLTIGDTNPGTFLGGTWITIMEGLFPVGVDGGTYTPGATGGAAAVALVEAENGPHAHGVVDPGHAHQHTFNPAGVTGTAGGSAWDASNSPTSSDQTGISIATSGNGNPHENRPPFFAVYFWQRTA